MKLRLIAVLAVVVGAAACQPMGTAPPPPTSTSVDATATSPLPTIGRRFTGYGFDKCSAPTTAQMSAWLASPYRGFGVYIGGSNAACPPSSVPHLGPSWVEAVTSQGWTLMPIWVGPQAPCRGGTGAKFSYDYATAAAQGAAEANLAADSAAAFGMGPAPDPTRRTPSTPAGQAPLGSPIYYDLEAYPRGGTCSNAVVVFVDAWVEQIHVRGHQAGFYSSGASGIADMVGVVAQNLPYSVPDDLWFAHWNGVASAYDNQYVPNTYWVGRRHHQYQGGHNETWANVTLNIDSNASDGYNTWPTLDAEFEFPDQRR